MSNFCPKDYDIRGSSRLTIIVLITLLLTLLVAENLCDDGECTCVELALVVTVSAALTIADVVVVVVAPCASLKSWFCLGKRIWYSGCDSNEREESDLGELHIEEVVYYVRLF